MKKKGIRNVLVTLGIISLFLIGGYIYILYIFTGDVFMNSEKYIVDKSFNDLDLEIYQFKKANPKYCLITTNEQGEEYKFQDYNTPKHYHVFFYWEDKNLTVQCLIDPVDDKNALLSLYAVSKGVNFGTWKSINTDDLTKEENAELKKKFETEILNKLGKWKHKRWYN